MSFVFLLHLFGVLIRICHPFGLMVIKVFSLFLLQLIHELVMIFCFLVFLLRQFVIFFEPILQDFRPFKIAVFVSSVNSFKLFFCFADRLLLLVLESIYLLKIIIVVCLILVVIGFVQQGELLNLVLFCQLHLCVILFLRGLNPFLRQLLIILQGPLVGVGLVNGYLFNRFCFLLLYIKFLLG